jgi:hypothetical protein
MQTEAVFENIAERIQQEIKKAQSSIYIAVAWFTNQTLFDELVKKANDGCSVLLMISNDEINLNSSIDYGQLNIGKSKVYKIGDGKKELLHHKFCVIDHNTVITGSYNWSYKAENNFENIIVTCEDSSLAQQFIKEFDELQNQYYPNDKEVVSDFPLNKIIKRLEILKNYIMLEDVDDVNSESSKLIQYDFNSDLKNIIESIKNGELADAINHIEQFISKNNQISIWTDPEISALKLELKLLENQLVSFENEKTEIEGFLQDFQRKHTLKVGEIISQILKFRKLKFKDDEEKFEEAENDENEYNEQFEFEKKKEVFELNVDEEKDLKKAYRKAAFLCHPNLFQQESDEIQKQAEQIMVELAIANKKKDLKRVNEILNDLQKGILTSTKGDSVSDKIKLRAIANRLRSKIKDIENEIINIKQSEQYQAIVEIEDWDTYLDELKIQLNNELDLLKQEIED